MDTYRSVAADLDLAWVEGKGPGIQEALEGLPLYALFPSRRITNRMTGVVDGAEVLVYELWQWTEKGQVDFRGVEGERPRPIQQTVIGIRTDGLDLPPFVMVPEGLFQKIGALFGAQDIDFEDSPRFSRQYTLRGEGEPEIRRTFSPEVRAYFSDHRGWSLEGSGDVFALYRAGEVALPKEVPERLAAGRAVLALFG